DKKDLKEELTGWMDILSLEKVNKKDMMIVRNDKLQARVGIDITHHPELRGLKTGHKLALTNGEYDVSDAKPAVVKKYAVVLIITPSETAEISYEGEYGFSCLKVTESEVEV
ncbi:MAG: hypothetical protein ACXAAK_12880, partial [Candidatus Thorarchaeota archaeon]